MEGLQGQTSRPAPPSFCTHLCVLSGHQLERCTVLCSRHLPFQPERPWTESRWKNLTRTLPSTQEEASQRVLILPGLSGTRKYFPWFRELSLGLAQGPVWGQGELWGRYWLRRGTGSTRGPRCTQRRETAGQGAARDHRAHS